MKFEFDETVVVKHLQALLVGVQPADEAMYDNFIGGDGKRDSIIHYDC